MKTLREYIDLIESAQTVSGQDVVEARRLKGADLQLKLVDRQYVDDTDLDDVVVDYYFDVYQNGQKVGHAEGDSYHGELVVKTDFNREFKLDTYHDKDHPLIQQFEKIQQQGLAEVFAPVVALPQRTKKELTPAQEKSAERDVKLLGKYKDKDLGINAAMNRLEKFKQKHRKDEQGVAEEQLEETSDEAVAKIESLFRNK